MGATTEELIYKVDIVSNANRITELATETSKAKEAFATLQKQVNAGAADVALLEVASARLGATLAANSQETRILTNANNAQIAANKAAAGSVDELKAKSALLGSTLRNASVGTKDFTGGLNTAVTQGLSPFRKELDRGTGLLGKFKSGSDLVKTGLASLQGAGETGALGFKAVAAGIALTGIGLLVLALTAVVGYFTQTNEGGKILKQTLAGVGIVVTTLANGVFEAGKYLTKLFTDPTQVAKDFVAFLKDQVINRVAAFGMLLDGIRNRDFKKITDSIIQFNLGITNGTDKASAYVNGLISAGKAAGTLEAQLQALSKRRKENEVDEVKEKGRVEELLRLSKDRTLSADDRFNKLKEAGNIESDLAAKSLDITAKELALLQQRNKAKGLSVTSDEIQEERDKRKEYDATVAERNSTLATIKARQSRFVLEERAESAQAAQDAVKERIAQTEAELLTVQAGSEKELALRQKLVTQQAELEAAGQKKSAADRAVAYGKSLLEIEKLEDEFNKKEQDKASKKLDDDVARAGAELASEKRHRDEAAKDSEESFKQVEGVLERGLARQRTALEDNYADGLVSKKQYDAGVELLDKSSIGARIVLAKQFNRDTTKLEEDQAKVNRKYRLELTNEEKAAQLERLEFAERFGSEIGSLFAEALTTTGESLAQFSGKVLVLLLSELEKYILAQEAKTLARAVAEGGIVGIVEAGAEVALITTAFEAAKAVISQDTATPKFEAGGIVPGFSTTGDKVPVLANSGEIIMSRPASIAYAPVLSYLNQLVGGANFAPGFTPGAQVAAPIDGGLMARTLGMGAMPTAAEIGREVARNVPTSIQVDTINNATARKARVRAITSI